MRRPVVYRKGHEPGGVGWCYSYREVCIRWAADNPALPGYFYNDTRGSRYPSLSDAATGFVIQIKDENGNVPTQAA